MSATIDDEVLESGSLWVCRRPFSLEFKKDGECLDTRWIKKYTVVRVMGGPSNDEHTTVFDLDEGTLQCASLDWQMPKLTRAEFLQYFQTSTDFLEEVKKANLLKPWQAQWLQDIQESKNVKGSSEDCYLTPEVVSMLSAKPVKSAHERCERWLAEGSEALTASASHIPDDVIQPVQTRAQRLRVKKQCFKMNMGGKKTVLKVSTASESQK